MATEQFLINVVNLKEVITDWRVLSFLLLYPVVYGFFQRIGQNFSDYLILKKFLTNLEKMRIKYQEYKKDFIDKIKKRNGIDNEPKLQNDKS